jgi:hypothetical protein
MHKLINSPDPELLRVTVMLLGMVSDLDFAHDSRALGTTGTTAPVAVAALCGALAVEPHGASAMNRQ